MSDHDSANLTGRFGCKCGSFQYSVVSSMEFEHFLLLCAGCDTLVDDVAVNLTGLNEQVNDLASSRRQKMGTGLN